MPDITATDAARHFADLLDGVEHRGEHYTIVRRGKAVAQLEPVSVGRGADVKSLLRRHRPDAAWPKDLTDVRGLLEVEEREMSLLLLDTTFLIDVERGGLELDDAIGDDDDVAIAAVTMAELLVGAKLASGRRREVRRAYVDVILESLPIIAYDREVAVEHAELLVAVRDEGRPRGAHDLLIAATARATGRTVVAADREAFSDLPGVATAGHR